jgi:hypothetical protein
LIIWPAFYFIGAITLNAPDFLILGCLAKAAPCPFPLAGRAPFAVDNWNDKGFMCLSALPMLKFEALRIRTTSVEIKGRTMTQRLMNKPKTPPMPEK